MAEFKKTLEVTLDDQDIRKAIRDWLYHEHDVDRNDIDIDDIKIENDYYGDITDLTAFIKLK